MRCAVICPVRNAPDLRLVQRDFVVFMIRTVERNDRLIKMMEPCLIVSPHDIQRVDHRAECLGIMIISGYTQAVNRAYDIDPVSLIAQVKHLMSVEDEVCPRRKFLYERSLFPVAHSFKAVALHRSVVAV